MPLYLHWGDLANANANADRALRNHKRFMSDPSPDGSTHCITLCEWPQMLYMLGRTEDAADFMRRNKADWSNAKDTVRQMCERSPLFGSLAGGGFVEEADFLVHIRMLWVLLGDDEITAEQVLSELPPPEELAMLGVFPLASDPILHPAHFNGWTSLLWPALALEKVGAVEAALPYVEKALDVDGTQGGGSHGIIRTLAHCCHGRLLASIGKMDEARAAFAAAEALATARAYWMLAALAVRDLTEHVLSPAGSLDEGRDQLAPLVKRLTGPGDALTTLLGGHYV